MLKYWIALFAAVVLSSFSQMLLKKAAQIKYENVIREYLNPWVISFHAAWPRRQRLAAKRRLTALVSVSQRKIVKSALYDLLSRNGIVGTLAAAKLAMQKADVDFSVLRHRKAL